MAVTRVLSDGATTSNAVAPGVTRAASERGAVPATEDGTAGEGRATDAVDPAFRVSVRSMCDSGADRDAAPLRARPFALAR